MPVLFLIFVIMPLVEFTVLYNVGQQIGFWNTIGLVILTAFIGVNLLRYQGLSTLLRARERMNSGEIPAKEMVEGIILAVGGALLVTPGFVTDFIGFCCLIPYSRLLIARQMQKHFTVVNMSHTQQTHSSSFEEQQRYFEEQRLRGEFDADATGSDRTETGRSEKGRSAKPGSGNTYDGEYRRED